MIKLYDIELEDVLPFRYPLQILCEYLKKWKNCVCVEPRQIFASGIESAIPIFVAGIYADKVLIGECIIFSFSLFLFFFIILYNILIILCFLIYYSSRRKTLYCS